MSETITITTTTEIIRAAAIEAVRPVCEERDRLAARVAELEAAVERMAPVVAAADAWRDDPCKGLGSLREGALAGAIDGYRAKVRGPAGHSAGHSPDPDAGRTG